MALEHEVELTSIRQGPSRITVWTDPGIIQRVLTMARTAIATIHKGISEVG